MCNLYPRFRKITINDILINNQLLYKIYYDVSHNVSQKDN